MNTTLLCIIFIFYFDKLALLGKLKIVHYQKLYHQKLLYIDNWDCFLIVYIICIFIIYYNNMELLI